MCRTHSCSVHHYMRASTQQHVKGWYIDGGATLNTHGYFLSTLSSCAAHKKPDQCYNVGNYSWPNFSHWSHREFSLGEGTNRVNKKWWPSNMKNPSHHVSCNYHGFPWVSDRGFVPVSVSEVIFTDKLPVNSVQFVLFSPFVSAYKNQGGCWKPILLLLVQSHKFGNYWIIKCKYSNILITANIVRIVQKDLKFEYNTFFSLY